jgi:hypothetical protein
MSVDGIHRKRLLFCTICKHCLKGERMATELASDPKAARPGQYKCGLSSLWEYVCKSEGCRDLYTVCRKHILVLRYDYEEAVFLLDSPGA